MLRITMPVLRDRYSERIASRLRLDDGDHSPVWFTGGRPVRKGLISSASGPMPLASFQPKPLPQIVSDCGIVRIGELENAVGYGRAYPHRFQHFSVPLQDQQILAMSSGDIGKPPRIRSGKNDTHRFAI